MRTKYLLFLLIFLSRCKSINVANSENNCHDLIAKIISNKLYEKLKISSQSDGVFHYYVSIRFYTNNKFRIISIESNSKDIIIENDLKNCIELMEINMGCKGILSFKISIDTIRKDYQVIPYPRIKKLPVN